MSESNIRKLTNKYFLLLAWIVGITYSVGLFYSYTCGSIALVPVIIISIVLIVSPCVATLVYRSHPSSVMLHHICTTPFGLAYWVTLVSHQSVAAPLLVVPLLLVAGFYLDLRLLFRVFAGTTVGVVTWLVFRFNPADSTIILIEVVLIVLVAIAIYVSTKFSKMIRDSVIEENIKVNLAHQNQQTTIKQITDAINLLTQNTANLSFTINTVENGSQAIYDSIKTINTGCENTTLNIQHQTSATSQIHEQIQETSQLSTEINEASVEGFNVFNQVQDTIKTLSTTSSKIDDKNSTLYAVCERLITKTKEVQSIISMITSISEQTNLLSLNASIEAARAGESGRGFAVVANEVKTLAEQSKTSANTVGDILSELQQEVEIVFEEVTALSQINTEAVGLINTTDTQVNELNHLLGTLNESLIIINKKIFDTLDSNQAIEKSIEKLNSISQDTLSNTEEAFAHIEGYLTETENAKVFLNDLSQLTKDLEHLISSTNI